MEFLNLFLLTTLHNLNIFFIFCDSNKIKSYYDFNYVKYLKSSKDQTEIMCFDFVKSVTQIVVVSYNLCDFYYFVEIK